MNNHKLLLNHCKTHWKKSSELLELCSQFAMHARSELSVSRLEPLSQRTQIRTHANRPICPSQPLSQTARPEFCSHSQSSAWIFRKGRPAPCFLASKRKKLAPHGRGRFILKLSHPKRRVSASYHLDPSALLLRSLSLSPTILPQQALDHFSSSPHCSTLCSRERGAFHRAVCSYLLYRSCKTRCHHHPL